MSLRTTQANQCLDKKLLIFGYEVPDILAIFILLSLLNTLLGSFGQSLILVWLPSLAFAAFIRLMKRGKPDGYLVHWIRFKMAPKKLSAFPEIEDWKVPPKLNGGTYE